MRVEINKKAVTDRADLAGGGLVAITPPIDQDYWVLRVPLSDTQAIVCFPKFLTIGCGFQQEEDWNCNLPLSCETEEIFNHIKGNKGKQAIPDDECRRAIDLLKTRARELGLI